MDNGSEVQHRGQVDPVHYHESGALPNHEHHQWERTGWYFWDETWADRIGPYYTEEACRLALAGYGVWLDNGMVDPLWPQPVPNEDKSWKLLVEAVEKVYATDR